MKDKAQLNPVGIKFNNVIVDKHKIPTELAYTNERLRAYVFDKAKPMQFYTRQELDNEIEQIKRQNDVIFSSNATYVAPEESTRIDTPMHPSDMLEPTSETVKELNYKDYSDYPELQQKIKDHLTIRALRSKYLHTSHECSALNAILGIAYFDPYGTSVRSKPSRKIINS
ncbi:MAG: hypothetical protein ACK5L5_09815 [Bacteroidales bacterium]